MNRREAREQVFILIFENMFKHEDSDELFACARESRELQDDLYITEVYTGVCEHGKELDDIISANAKGWNISRISKVTLCCLQLALYEMLYRKDIPVSVSINEAVELIKKYATESDAAFANGILGTVSRNVSPEA